MYFFYGYFLICLPEIPAIDRAVQAFADRFVCFVFLLLLFFTLCCQSIGAELYLRFYSLLSFEDEGDGMRSLKVDKGFTLYSF